MKHITIGEINKFQCIGSQCLYTCCAEWNISVDKATDEYYQSVQGPFGEELKRKIDRKQEPAKMKLEDGRCPFLNEENLCRIYMELGPEHLCRTCKFYPRLAKTAGHILFHFMTISCPEVGRIILSRKSPMEMRVMEDDSYRASRTVGEEDWNFFRLAERAFYVNMSILQNRAYTVAERERAFALFNRALQDALDADRMTEAETLIDYFSSSENYSSLVESRLSAQLPSKVRLFRKLCELFVKRDDYSVTFKMFANSVRYIQSKDADMDALSEMLKTLDGEEFQREQEHLLAYLLFNHYLSDSLLDKSAERNLFGRAVLILTFFQFYRVFISIFSAIEQKSVDLNTRALVIAHLSRYFEHDKDLFLTDFQNALKTHQFYDMGFLFQLIS